MRTGRGENTVYVALQHMKNHVWREIWPAMPSDARQYWRLVTKQVMSLYDGGGGGMKDAAGAAGRAAGREAARESASHGQSEAAQRAASERASAEASRRTMAELREATTKPCTRQHLFQVGEYQMQDTQLMEPFEVNVAFIMNAYLGDAPINPPDLRQKWDISFFKVQGVQKRFMIGLHRRTMRQSTGGQPPSTSRTETWM